MCAIAGLICLKRQCHEEEHVFRIGQMCDLQHHRGPDDRGLVSLGHVCLGSNRLSIIDLTDAGHMPMSDEGGGYWIVYNGEVYNFVELQAELSRCGHIFRSRTDTEVVLHAFQQWGERCLERFVGMFAFAVYDRAADTVTLVRDRFGQHVGLLTERDVMRALGREGASAIKLTAADLMTRDIVAIHESAFVFRAIGRMMSEVLDGLAANGEEGNGKVEARIKAEALELCRRFPIY